MSDIESVVEWFAQTDAQMPAHVPAGQDGTAADGYGAVRTSCGRVLRIGRTTPRGTVHAQPHVSLSVTCERHDGEHVWMSLTPAECRALAGTLLAQAAAADQVLAAPGAAPAAMAAAAVRLPAEETLPAGRVEVTFLAHETFGVHVRGHHSLTDQPMERGGHDVAATPTELLVASLASCVAYYAGSFLARHGYSRNGLAVSAEFDMAAHPARVGAVRLLIRVPAELPPQRVRALRAVASRCTVHNTLHDPPTVDIGVA